MKNFNVHEAGLKKKRYKIHKVVIGTIGVITIAATIAAGTFVFNNLNEYHRFKEEYNNKQSYYEEVTPSDTPEVVDNTPNVEEVNDIKVDVYNPTLGTTNKNLSNTYLSLNASDYSEFEKYIKSINVNYPGEEVFGIDEALEKYNQLNFSVANNSNNAFGSSDEITSAQLIDVVKANNKKYLSEAKKGSNFYKEIDSKELSKVCEIISKTVNDFMKTNLIDKEAIKYILSDLKIFDDATPNNAYTTGDNCLIVNSDMITVLQTINPKVDAFRNTIIHEVMHMFQKSSPDMVEANNYDMHFGVNYSWSDLKINPLMNEWYAEASAEKSVSNYTGDPTIVYNSMISYLESMSLSTILDNNVKVHQTENINFGKSLDPLFKQFNAETLEEQKEIIKLFYATDIIQTESDDFFERYEESIGRKLTDQEIDTLCFTIKGSICLSLTKQFYLNLAEQVSQNKVGLQDIFYLITVFENDINSHIKYTDVSRFDYTTDFIKEYIVIQDSFFKVLSKTNSYDNNQLLDDYNTYAMTINVNGVDSPNHSLNWLDSDKRNYILERGNYLTGFSTGNIRNSYIAMMNATLESENVKVK